MNHEIPATAMIQAAHISKRFGTVAAVDDLSLSVSPGVCFGLLGPNGAGKTTLIEILEGILTPTGGELLYMGHVPGAAFREKIGIMFQDTALLAYLTVYETLAAFHALYQHPDDLERIIEVCHLNEIRNRFNDKISGGQRQRLLLALALINQPELLFLDEPSTGLDPQARRHLWDIINVVKKRGKTIILTTHYMEEAQQMCDQVAIMDQGKIIVQGTPEQLVSQYTQGAVIHLRSDCLNQIRGAIPFEHYQEQDKITIHVQEMNQAVRTLLDLGVDLSQMDVALPNLETVFLNLTGRRLRD